MNNDVTLSTFNYSYGFVFSYFIISIIFFVFLFYLKKYVTQKHSYPLFILSTIIVVICGAVQFIVFGEGDDFFSLFYPVDFIKYQVVQYGGLFFTIAYSFLLPKNTYYKEMTAVENQHKNKKQG
ncbi:hypothetical protein AXX16_2269 [Serratia rubidaea]|uniref:hypothetical protein n=1 Tax=Serratia rubidaea TaxID=61652 RepID=UPI00078B02DD|nr:hypothetical protein [Serratia rubidaea]AML57970.1 hypothetical protein AXX16_2269 [Serratia rubidaea]